MTSDVEVAQTLLLLLLLAVTVLMWLRWRSTRIELLELRSSEENWALQSSELAALTASCLSRIDVLHAKAVESEAESRSWRTALERARQADADAARRNADAATAQVQLELNEVRHGLSNAVSSASGARKEELRRQVKADQLTGDLSDRLRDLEGRMGDFLHGCDELVRAEIVAQLADALPMLDDPIQK